MSATTINTSILTRPIGCTSCKINLIWPPKIPGRLEMHKDSYKFSKGTKRSAENGKRRRDSGRRKELIIRDSTELKENKKKSG